MTNSTVLGIMVCKTNHLFYEKEFYRFLQSFGQEKKIFVYVFYPDYIDWKNKTVKGFRFSSVDHSWLMKSLPLPNYVYDRCFYSNARIFQTYKPSIDRIKQEKMIRFLGYGLRGKLEVHQMLSRNPKIVSHLPKTMQLIGAKQLIKWLNLHSIILKPIGGSHGSGVIKIIKDENRYIILGRNMKNEKIHLTFHTLTDFLDWIHAFVKGKRYLIQEYLTLSTSNQEPYDIRVLVQKNNNGLWEFIGMVARIGDSSNITSNLHGGARVENITSLLNREFGVDKAKEIEKKIMELAEIIPPYLESSHGRLFEIGLDLGIDRQGKVWVIEANSKPGRKVFSLLNDQEKRLKSLTQPIIFTDYLTHLKGSH